MTIELTNKTVTFSPEDLERIEKLQAPWPNYSGGTPFSTGKCTIQYVPRDFVNSACDKSLHEGCFMIERNGGGQILAIPESETDLLGKILMAINYGDGQFWVDINAPHAERMRIYNERKKTTNNRKGKVQVSLADLGL